MLQYETIFLAEATLTDQEVDGLIATCDQLVTGAGGKVMKIEKWGKRRLAYPILHKDEAIYVLMIVECPPSLVHEIERRYRMNDRILRHQTVRVESEAQLQPSPMMKPRPERDDSVPESAIQV
ncbi:MAG: 30S ribosomal protein S6 [Candidatus Polarisedimenticolia bacterium]